jgi:putative ABC transport system permease protein
VGTRDTVGDADHRPAPWVRTRLRAAPLVALLTAALALVTVFLAAALPRVQDRGANAALRDYVGHRGIYLSSLQYTSRTRPTDTVAQLAAVQRELTARIGAGLTLSPPGEARGVRARAKGQLNGPGYARLAQDTAPMLDLLYLDGLSDRVTLTAGTWPTPAPADGPLPIVVSAKAAETIGIRLGDTIDNGTLDTGGTDNGTTSTGSTGTGGGDSGRRRTTVVGLYRVNDPRDPFWDGLGCPDRACLNLGLMGQNWWQTTGFTDGAALPALTRWGAGAENFWRLPVDPAALRADRLDRTIATTDSFLTGPAARALVTATGRPDLRTASFLPDTLTRARDRYRAAMPLAAIGPAGGAGVATVVLCLAAALTTDRRTAELRLLRARGGSRTGVLLRLLGEGAATVLPAAALAAALALTLLPTPRWGQSVLAALAATLLALLAFPARAALLWARRRPPGGARRVIGELTVAAVTAAAVAEARRRGVGHSAAGPDPLLIAAPLLLAVTGGLLLARIEPPLIGRLARLAGRGRGLTAFLGLARAARDTSGRCKPSALPLLALLIAVTTTGFGTTVLDAVDHSRIRAARLTTGGDIALTVPEYATVPEAFTQAAADLPGLRTAAAVRVEPKALFVGAGSDYTKATVVVAEPAAYAEIARTTGAGAFDPAKLTAAPGGPDTPVPALFSRDLAHSLAAGAPSLHLSDGNDLRTTVAGIVDATPALPDPGGPFVVVPAGPAAQRLPELKPANRWLAVGDLDPERVRSLLRERGLTQPTGILKLIQDDEAAASRGSHGLPPGYAVHSSRELAAQLADDPLQQAAGRLFRYAAAAAAGFALLAVLLTLLRAAPERATVLARLRTMGLRPRQGLALITAEALPRALSAAAGGGVTALAAVALLGPAFDLSTLVGAKVGRTLLPAVLPVLLPTAGLALLVCLAVVAETLVAGRRQLAVELRAGDQP